MLKLLPKYCKRITENLNSRLVRIAGMYKLLPDNQDFLIMENVLPRKERAIIFDLKGSLVDRLVEVEGVPRGVVLKDQNFIDSKIRITIEKEQASRIVSALEEDFMMLTSENIMDYSVLIAVYEKTFDTRSRYIVKTQENTYSIGVIDILQEYNFAKISEKKFKSFYKKNKLFMSVAEPNIYHDRFLDFITKIFYND